MKRHKLAFRLIAALLAVALFSSTSLAQGMAVFGPQKFERETGEPIWRAETFYAQYTEGALTVFNGDESGNHRVSSVTIFLNGQQILGPSDFNQQVDSLEAPVTLIEGENTVEVQVRSGPEVSSKGKGKGVRDVISGFITVGVTVPVDLTTTSGILAALSTARTQELAEDAVNAAFEMATIDDIAFCKEILSDADISDLATFQLEGITVSTLGTFFESLVDVFKMGDPEGAIEITKSFDEVLLDLQTQMNAAYEDPTDPANALLIFMTTPGPSIPDIPPTLSAEIPLSPVQATLFSTWLIHSQLTHSPWPFWVNSRQEAKGWAQFRYNLRKSTAWTLFYSRLVSLFAAWAITGSVAALAVGKVTAACLAKFAAYGKITSGMVSGAAALALGKLADLGITAITEFMLIGIIQIHADSLNNAYDQFQQDMDQAIKDFPIWNDRYGYTWTLRRTDSTVTGTVSVGAPWLWNVSGSITSTSFCLRATNPNYNPAGPYWYYVLWFEYTGTVSADGLSASGTWVNWWEGWQGHGTWDANQYMGDPPIGLYEPEPARIIQNMSE